MAIIHHAELTPSKPETLAAWVPRQSWFVGDASVGPEILGSPRLDDPDGQVGVETFFVRFGDGPVLQVPVTYRGVPLDGVDPIGVMEHSVLGRRYVYDGITDPVYVGTVVAAIDGGGREAELIRDGEHLPTRGELRGVPAGAARVPGLDPRRAVVPEEAGEVAVMTFPGGALRVWRHPSTGEDIGSGARLVGAWRGGPTVLLAELV
ncbi:hypothetical protein FDO65_05750 [Nakamurella flava]|uniref:Maltokinase N-terminal cap domain-containing protein n=1 Tax=Nakamurella flava TaxID=2576308 RepID=A0A4V6CSQ5_9ACTN|nr:hypothetical protein [Nakamurella flava]TKV61135.1 hypothetical protein FDO65_05750 [Nakamurella flava]